MTTLRDAMMMMSSGTRQPQLATESSYTNSLCVPIVGPQHT